MRSEREVRERGKIKSIAELKNAIEYAFVKEEFARENVMFAVKEFEAGIRSISDEELQHLEKRELLRRVLGGEAG